LIVECTTGYPISPRRISFLLHFSQYAAIESSWFSGDEEIVNDTEL